MKNIYIVSILAGALALGSCSKEDPFRGGTENGDGNGQVSKSALVMELKNNPITATRAEADVNINDFNVLFFKQGNTQPVAKYKYGEMPEVITLPAGSYTCTATYGEDRQAEWESPYFLGSSEPFEVRAYEITSEISRIECTLENIMVTINYDASLRSAMSPDSYVEVKVGDSSALRYGVAEADAKKAGYFKHGQEISLVAVFHGTVNGEETVETKSLANVAKGYHYNITFRLHTGGGSDATGDANADVNVDASVSVTDIARDVELPDDELLDDSERPTEGGEDPQPPVPGGEAPVITAQAPVDLDKVNDGNAIMNAGQSFIINIVSTAEEGLTTFKVKINSEKLSKAELEGVGLSDELDLIDPQNLASPLQTLGLLVKLDADGNKVLNENGETIPVDSYLGYKKINFDLTGFLGLLGALGSGEHEFVLTVADANGTTTRSVKISM